MGPVDRVLGQSLATLAELRLQKLGPGSVIRIKRNDDPVILATAEALDGFDFDGTSDRVAIVVSADASTWPDLPDRFHLPPDTNPVSFRNEHQGSLVILERDTFSGAQSLGQLPTIGDDDILHSVDVMEEAWKALGGGGTRPVALSRLSNEILDIVAGDGLAVRQWADFCVESCQLLAAGVVDEADVAGVLGSTLPRLGLLPDDGLERVATESRRKQRFYTNTLFSQNLDPRGQPIDSEQLSSVAAQISFKNLEGEAYSTEEQVRLREAVRARLYRTEDQPEESISFSIWEQLFQESTRKKGIGTKILDHLRAEHAERVEEYLDLGVRDQLDARGVNAAQDLLSADPEVDDDPPLVALLPTRLRRTVERLATPRATDVDDPLRHLVRELYRLVQELSESDEVPVISIERIATAEEEDIKSVTLFDFLYGKTLRAAFKETETALRLQVRYAVDVFEPSRKTEGSDDDQTESSHGWAPIQLVLRNDQEGELHRFRWAPLEHIGLVALLALITQHETDSWRSEGKHFDDWCSEALTGPLTGGLEGSRGRVEGGPVSQWLDLRSRTFKGLIDGLSTETLEEYVTAWEEILSELNREHVPTVAAVPEVEDFLAVDSLDPSDGSRVLLATHPLRLRWLMRHLQESRKQLTLVCDADLQLNPVNEGLYFDLLDQLSPHEQPPILSQGEQVFIAVREQDGHEHFARLKDGKGTHHDWLSDLDDSSIDVLADTVIRYLEAHPNKADGVSILFVIREGGARLLQQLIKKALRSGRGRVGATLHVVAPRAEFRDIDNAIADFDNPDERQQSDFPSIQVVVHPWGDGDLPQLESLTELLDLAIVPNLFGASTTAIDRTRPRLEAHGRFDSWSGATSYIEATETTEHGVPNVSRIMLPDQPDPVLWDWSTINVRQNRGTPVAEDLDAVDFITMQVKFNQGAEMFERLHSLAHWVVTLDTFIGRSQIELLQSGPDVILLRPRVGKNHSYNLVVSSMTGRDFVTGRLRSRLEGDFPGKSIDGLPALLYDRGRALFPGLVLRSLGLGWAIQELIGLVVTHRTIGRELSATPREGFEAWISLDEQPSWFGTGQVRADLARVTAAKTEDGLKISVLVVESKFRKSEDVAAADDQVTNSVELLRSALAPEGTADGRFWRRQILDVAEQSSRRASANGGVASLSCWGEDGIPSAGIPNEVRNMWLVGDYELLSVDGLVCTMSSALSPTDAGTYKTRSGHTWYRLGPDAIWETLAQLGAHSIASNEVGDGREDFLTLQERSSPQGVAERTSSTDSFREEQASEVVGDDDEDELAPNSDPADTAGERGNPEALEQKYQAVLNVFAEYQVRVQKPQEDAYNEGPGFYVFRVVPAPGVKPDAISKLAPELKLKLGLEKDLSPKSYIDSGAVVFEVPKSDEDRYYVAAESIWERTEASTNQLFAPIGEDINGHIVGIDFSSSESPHLLIAGMTGSGKSIALETILQGLCRSHGPDRLRLGLIDPKGTELNDLDEDPRLLEPIGMYPDEAVNLLHRAVQEMDDRRHAFRSVRARNLPEYNEKADDAARLPWWVIVLDEYADLTSDKDERKDIEDSLKRLSQKARASGIHVIVATQKPSAEVISTTVRSNLPAQLALRVKTGSDSRVIIDEGGAEALAGKGDALFKTAQRTVRIQCAAVTR